MGNGIIRTPGVYITETDAFPNSVVPVSTSEPAFIGYTEKADCGQRALALVPTRIGRLQDFETYFGGAGGDGYGLHDALRLFFGNGGGSAWVVSVGPFGPPAKANFLAGLAALEKEPAPAIVAAPEALRLSEHDYHEVARAMIAHCAGLDSRMAIVDLHGGDRPEAGTPEGLAASIVGFRAAMADVPQEQRSFAAAYHPWLVTGTGAVPPSAAMAGIWAMRDNDTGVWKAPANMSVAGVNDVAIRIDDAMQEDMNVPLDGLAVNAIRRFPAQGILVWGARTLDGNSQDFRYIPVRRTTIMIEQSIRHALQAYGFEPNDANTWAGVRSMVAAFLTGLWREGGLVGARPDDAFSVQCGLGTTMTAQDMLDGRMLVTVLVALVRPAEFVALSFAQDMQAA